MHERPHTEQTMSEIMDMFTESFQKAAPRKATLLDWEKQAFELESILDRPRSGRRVTRDETCAEAASSVDKSQSGNEKQSWEFRDQLCIII